MSLTNLEGIAVNPADGRIWAADDNVDQIWSFDPVTGDGQLEISFFRGGEPRLDHQINFHDPCMKFSNDGKRLAVSDITDSAEEGWVWIFDRERFGVPPDFDRDFDVDDDDFDHLRDCAALSGPAIPLPPEREDCLDADIDGDTDVDQADYAVWQRCVSGAGIPADLDCAD